MSGTRSLSASGTFTRVDVEKVVRRVGADMKMIADSTRAWDAAKTADYIHDIEVLAQAGYLRHVDLTLFGGDVEVKAARFVVSVDACGWTNERPGEALWPRVDSPRLRIVLSYNAGYDAAARERMAARLRIGWVACHDDTSHASLRQGGSRSYASKAFGIQRTDWAA